MASTKKSIFEIGVVVLWILNAWKIFTYATKSIDGPLEQRRQSKNVFFLLAALKLGFYPKRQYKNHRYVLQNGIKIIDYRLYR